MAIDETQLLAVDRFLSDPNKVLDGPQPAWVLSTGYNDYQLSWPILEEDTGFIRSSLKFRVPMEDYYYPSVGLIFRNEPISRLDRTRPSSCEPNPNYASRLGLPARVCGPHVHAWSDNRLHVATTGKWELPARRPVADNMTRLEQMFFWFCDYASVRIEHENRRLYLPERGLFGGSDA